MNPFETLGVEPRFDLDRKALEQRHRDLSGALHPDRYAGRPAAERRMALDKAIGVNEAFRLLRDPVRRAEALLSTHDVSVGETAEPKASPELLMEMMEIREELSEAKAKKDLDAVGALGDRMRSREKAVTAKLASGFEAAGDDTNELEELLPTLGELRYIRRFFEELDAIEEQLSEEL
ncbi:MAG: Fe-S protein assembly co-chaperone HscB [Polyangiaceae bacterium]